MQPLRSQATQRRHPCFHKESKASFGRIHLPVAPKCNIQCAYCNIKHDCLHENRPGVTSSVISPEEALERLKSARSKMGNISVAGIAGPGDAFCEPDLTLETFELIRKNGLDIDLCVSSNGLNVAEHAHSLSELGVQFVSITINTVDPKIGSILCKKVKVNKTSLTGRAASEKLIDNQLEAIAALKAASITIKINTVVAKGINDHHIPFLAKRLHGMGVDLMNLIPLIPLPETSMAGYSPPVSSEINKLRELASKYIPQMAHCKRCRSDAVGLLESKQHRFLQ